MWGWLRRHGIAVAPRLRTTVGEWPQRGGVVIAPAAVCGLIAFLAGFEPELLPRPGVIIVNSPGVYTRQRLVNDRLNQTAWLNEQLEATSLQKGSSFQSIDGLRVVRHANEFVAKLRLSDGALESTPRPEKASEAQKTIVEGPKQDIRDQIEVKPTTADLFRSMNSYRDEIRSEIMQAQLDDRHDILGNTIYRLAFDVTVLPGARTSDLAFVKIRLNQNPQDKNNSITYNEWLHEIQKKVDESINNISNTLSTRRMDEIQRREFITFLLDKICKRFGADGFIVSITGDYAQCSHYNRQVISRLVDEYRKFAIEKERPYVIEARFIDETLQLNNINSYEKNQRTISELFQFALNYCQKLNNRFNARYYNSIYVPEEVDAIASESEKVLYGVKHDPTGLKFNCPISTSPTETIIYIEVLDRYFRSGKFKRAIMKHDVFSPEVSALIREIYYGRDVKGNEQPKRFVKQKITSDQGSSDSSERDQAGIVPWDSCGVPKKYIDGPENGSAVVRCSLPDLTSENLRCLAAEFQKYKLNLETTRRGVRISDLFEARVEGTEVQDCNLRVYPTADGPIKLGSALGTSEVFAYSLSPKNFVQRIATAADVRNAAQLLLDLKGTSARSVLQNAIESMRSVAEHSRAVQRNPVIVAFGFGANPGDNGNSSNPEVTNFGWMIAPQLNADMLKRREHVDSQYSLSAVVSLPSWWKEANLEIETCWLSRSKLDQWGVTANRGLQICPNTRAALWWDAPDENTSKSDKIRLPGAVSEISRKLGFEVTEEPYLKEQLAQSVEEGRAGAVLIQGSRLWRSTTVTMGSQNADQIIVLPNMEGIIAKFNCVQRTAEPVETAFTGRVQTLSAAGKRQQVRVWTSEGVTLSFPVTLRKFTPLEKDRLLLKDEVERPCYGDQRYIASPASPNPQQAAAR